MFCRNFALGLLFATPVAAQSSAIRLTDINTSHTGPAATTDRIGDYFFLREMVTAGPHLWFTGDDGIHGVELWRTDGTPAETQRVTDLCPGRCSAHPRALTAFGSRLFFIADDGAHGAEPWISDGTAAGTTLLADLWPGLRDGGGYGWAVATDTHIVFGGTTPGEGWEPWVTDGTAAGTHLLSDLRPGPASSSPLGAGRLGSYAFFAADDGVHGTELWRTDGQTTVLVEIESGPTSGFELTGNLGDRRAETHGLLCFAGTTLVSGRELWCTDGTAAGTRLVADTAAGPASGGAHYLTAWSGDLYFVASPAGDGPELWRSDGTPAGTLRVRDLSPGAESGFPRNLIGTPAGLFFEHGEDLSGRFLWISDGTEAGTRALAGARVANSAQELVAAGSGVAFYGLDEAHGLEPWFSDGTEAGTVRLADLAPGPASSFGPWDYVRGWRRDSSNGRGFFWAWSPGADFELWSTDGTPAGTRLHEINTMASSIRSGRLYYYFDGPDYEPVRPAATPTGLAFLATDGPLDPAHPAPGTTGLELWHVDHGGGEVLPLGDLSPGPASSLPPALASHAGGVLFGLGSSLWRSAGTAGSTVLHEPGGTVTSFARLENALLAGGPSGLRAHSLDLGTSVSLPAVGDVFEGSPTRAFFGTVGAGFGVTDGTVDGTVGLSTGNQYGVSLTPAGLDDIVFVGSAETTGSEPWVSDGTLEGTRPLVDLRPGPESAFPFSNPLSLEWPGWFPQLRTAGTTAYFGTDDGLHGQELWATDGTTPGTRLVADLFPGTRGADIRRITPVGSRVTFVADDGIHGRELWISDGTAKGTHLVRDLAPGPGSAVPQELTAIGEFLVFTAWTPELGREAWISDGTEIGTRPLVDIAPGPASSSPVTFVPAGGWLYFTANDNTTGDELWRLPLALLTTGTIFADGFESGDLYRWNTPEV